MENRTYQEDLEQLSLQAREPFSVRAGSSSAPTLVSFAPMRGLHTAAVQSSPQIRFLDPNQIPVGATSVVVVAGTDLPTTVDGYALVDDGRRPIPGVRVLSATVRSDVQVAVELLVDGAIALGVYQLQARTPAGADAAPLELINAPVTFVMADNPPVREPLAQDTGFRFILSYGEFKPGFVLLTTNTPSTPFGFAGVQPVNVEVDEVSRTFSFFVDSAGPWFILASYGDFFLRVPPALVVTPPTPIAPGQPQRVDISRGLATHSISFRPVDFQGREIVPSSVADVRALLTFRVVHRQTGTYLGGSASGFGRALNILVSDMPPEYTFNAVGGVGRKFGIPLHLYLYLFRKGIRTDLVLTNSAAQLSQREIVGPRSTIGPFFVIPELSFLRYTSPEVLSNGGFARAGGVFLESVSTMLGPDGRAPLYVLFSSDTQLDLSEPANAWTPDFPAFRLGLFTSDYRSPELLGLVISPYYTKHADSADSFIAVLPTRGQFDRLDIPAPGQIPLGTFPLSDATRWVQVAENNVQLQPQHFVPRINYFGGKAHVLADGSFEGTLDSDGDAAELREEVIFKLFRNDELIINKRTLNPVSSGMSFPFSLTEGRYRFLLQQPGLPSIGRPFPYMTRSTFKVGKVGAGRDGTPPALRKLQLLVGGRLAGTIDPAAGTQNALRFTIDSGADNGGTLQSVALSVSRDGSTFERVAVTALANGDWQAILPPAGSAARFDFKLVAVDLAGNRLVSRFSLPVGTDRGPGPAIPPDTDLMASSVSLSVTLRQGDATPAGQSLALSSMDDPIGYAVTADVPWLSVSPASGTTPATVMITVTAAGLAVGTYQGHLTVAADDPTIAPTRTVPVTLTVNALPAARVELSATPLTQSITAGQSATYAITLTRTNFTGAVNLAVVSGLPAGATAAFSPNPTMGTRSDLKVTTMAGTPGGTSPLTIRATASDGLTIAPMTVTLTVTPGNPAPSLSNLAPASVTAGSGAITLTATGANFLRGATLQVNGDARPTTVLSATQLTAQLLATDVATAGPQTITVVNPPPDGSRSNALTLTVTGPAVSLKAPSHLTATLVSPFEVALTWQDNSSGETGVRVYRKIGVGDPFSFLAGVGGVNLTRYTDTTVTPGNTYGYQVLAYAPGVGDSEFSNEASVTIPGDGRVPDAPTNLTAVGESLHISLNWTHNGTKVSGFKVERRVGRIEGYTQLALLPANARGYVDFDPPSKLPLTYRVQAYNAAGASDYSNEASASPVAGGGRGRGTAGRSASVEPAPEK